MIKLCQTHNLRMPDTCPHHDQNITRSYLKYAKNAQNIAPAPDGIFLVAGTQRVMRAPRFFIALSATCATEAPPENFNDQLNNLLQKGTQDENTRHSVICAAACTRPRGLKNIGTKPSAGAKSQAATATMSHWVDDSLNRFVAERMCRHSTSNHA